MKPDNHSPALNAALDISRSKSKLMVENALLRQRLIMVQRETKRPKITWRDRALIVFLTSKGIDQRIPGQAERPQPLESPVWCNYFIRVLLTAKFSVLQSWSPHQSLVE